MEVAMTTPMAETVEQRAAREAEECERARGIAERYDLDYVEPGRLKINNELLRSIPFDLMMRYDFVPEELAGNRLTIVMADPTDVTRLDELELLLGRVIEAKVGAAFAIDEILRKSESAQRVLDEATEDFRIQLVQEDDDGDEVLSIDRLTSDISPIIKLVDSTIFNAIQRRASDIHIETREREVVIKYRIDGVLYQAMEPIDKRHHQTIISRIKVMSELDIAEKRVPQDGRFKLRFKGRNIDFRVSIMPIGARRGLRHPHPRQGVDEQGVQEPAARHPRLRPRHGAQDPQVHPRALRHGAGHRSDRLGQDDHAVRRPVGDPVAEDKIITIEDPVEYQLKGITQIPVNEKKGLTFARGLRSILRHDPDKIMVGEIRDEETAQIAIQSALTGHLVFTTVHANNVVDVLGRFLNMNVDLYNFVSALNCVLAQRLVRKICMHCRAGAPASPQLLEESGLDPAVYGAHVFYEGAGCIECNGTGFLGRMAISELLDLSDRIRELILERRPASEIKRAARDEGMTFLRESALERALQGVTTLREINKVTFVE